jgi:pyridoxine 4-dehydrogenase
MPAESGAIPEPGSERRREAAAVHQKVTAEAGGTIRIGGDLEIHRLGFGAMRLTGEGIWGPPASSSEAARVLKRAIDLGIDFIDTADAYGPSVNEELIAAALHPYPGDLVIATKGGLVRLGPGKWRYNGNPSHLRQACEGSLRRLRVDTIDLYQLHRIDPRVPAEEQFATLAELQREGKIRHLGLSEVSVEEIEQAEKHFRVVTVQNKYHLEERKWAEVLDYCEEKSIGFIPWNPIAVGKLSGDSLDRVAQKHRASPVQIALAWLLATSPVMIPIPGTSRVKHLKENVRAAAIRLDEDDMRRLDE